MAKLQAAFLVLQCSLCLTIRVPVNWYSDSDINNDQYSSTEKSTEPSHPIIHKEYFQYTAVKPQFAIDIAASHGVKSPDKLYSSYPIEPYVGVEKPSLGQHHLLDPQKETYHPYQNFVNKSQGLHYVKPVTTSFEIYHPYKAEQPYLQEIYRDPVLNKIRDDLRDSKNRLQKYENEAGRPNIADDEYLENPEKTDHKHQPHKNVPVKFEIHRPLRRPIYYRPPMKYYYRQNKFKHPWNQNYVKVTPMHYKPVKNHLHQLRQHHALKFDDEHNEYPQLLPPESYAERPDGYDIFEKGKANYIKLRNNLDESINKASLESKPLQSQNLELQNNENYNTVANNEDDEFVPIKNYAQVRKTETTKHLPRERAFKDADSYDEILNAPRLREAIKSTKAQIVYSEEGYEDSAYDHAGERKHASDHEEHGGRLKENERSKGKYKIPSVSTSYDDEKGSAYRDQLLDGEKWQESKKTSEDEIDSEDYSEDEHDDFVDTDIHAENSNNNEDIKIKDTFHEPGEGLSKNDTSELKIRNKRQGADDELLQNSPPRSNKLETKLPVPKLNLNLSNTNMDDSSTSKQNRFLNSKFYSDIELKYPYYFTEVAGVNKDSPLRYAENLKLIPKKSYGGTEFYESRSMIACPEVDDEVDPVPDALKNGENPGDEADKDAEFKKFNEKQRLKGLGDKIDCFKAKYFGQNPLDSPFFEEEIILSPKPVPIPNLNIFKNLQSVKQSLQTPTKESFKTSDNDNILNILDDIYGKNNKSGMFQDINSPFSGRQLKSDITLNDVSKVNTDLNAILNSTLNPRSQKITSSNEYLRDLPELPVHSRKKRANSFIYEPYKIIKEGQAQDSKKTTTTSNISPLIKQLQSSRIIDRGHKKNNKEEIPAKRNAHSIVYQEIDKGRRQKNDFTDNTDQSQINIDKRRGEPRYNLEHQNHKNYYTPVESKSAVTIQEYEEKTGTKIHPSIKSNSNIEYLPQSGDRNLNTYSTLSQTPQKVIDYTDTQHSAASNTVRNIVRTTTLQPSKKTEQRLSSINNRQSNEEYVEYDSDDDVNVNDKYSSTTQEPTTTSKIRASRRRYVPERIVSTTDVSSTDKSIEIDNEDYIDMDNRNQPKIQSKLELVTRFRNQPPINMNTTKSDSEGKKNIENDDNIPKYREKKKKVSKSTLVTDTKTYGEDDEDMRKEDVDAMIGVKHTIDDYMPSYEKKIKGKEDEFVEGELYEQKNEHEDEDDDEDNESNDEDDEGEDDSDDDDEVTEDEDDEEDNDNNEDDKDNDQNVEEEREFISKTTENIKPEQTTDTPNRKTISKITKSPVDSTQSISTEVEPTPKIMRKKIEIHKELPVNKSSPHISQFKQDIKEIEIIKEMSPKTKRKPQKNAEALDLYKDENLAKDVNQLGGVEIFKEDLDLKSGPRHGGNYRSIESLNINNGVTGAINKHIPQQKSDVETSQTETKRLVDSTRSLPHARRNFQSRKSKQSSKTKDAEQIGLTDISHIKSNVHNRKAPQQSEIRNAKLIELVEDVDMPKSLHGGNLKSSNSRRVQSRNNNKNEKYIELDDDEEANTPRLHGGNFKSYENKRNDNMHGGNYRNAKLVQDNKKITETLDTETKYDTQKMITAEKNNAAAILSGYARAAPILTTTPVYILDPSKRMYYYVDT